MMALTSWLLLHFGSQNRAVTDNDQKKLTTWATKTQNMDIPRAFSTNHPHALTRREWSCSDSDACKLSNLGVTWSCCSNSAFISKKTIYTCWWNFFLCVMERRPHDLSHLHPFMHNVPSVWEHLTLSFCLLVNSCLLGGLMETSLRPFPTPSDIGHSSFYTPKALSSPRLLLMGLPLTST